MKYPKELLEKSEKYCFKLGLDNRFVHVPRTKLQADTLHSIQSDCELLHRDTYYLAKKYDSSDPYREQSKAQKAIDVLKEHLYKYHLPGELDMIAELSQLQNRLDIDSRVLKPKPTLDGIMSDIIEQLEDVGFKKTNIKENLLPVFAAMIKGE